MFDSLNMLRVLGPTHSMLGWFHEKPEWEFLIRLVNIQQNDLGVEKLPYAHRIRLCALIVTSTVRP